MISFRVRHSEDLLHPQQRQAQLIKSIHCLQKKRVLIQIVQSIALNLKFAL